MHKVLIVEDYPDDAEVLKEAVEDYGMRHGLEFTIECSESAQTLASGDRVYDAVFLDIELPGVDGMDAAALMRAYDASTPIIFVTNLSQYAAHSYEVDAAGFIVKPVTRPKIEMCLDKIAGRLRNSGSDRIVIAAEGGVRVIPARDIYYIELVRHDLLFHLVTGEEPIKLRGTMRQLESEIGGDSPLLKISSGCIVNMDYIRLAKGGSVYMENGVELPLSRSRKREALTALTAYLGKTF